MGAVSVEMPKSAKAMVWTGCAVTGLVALFLAFDSGIKLMQLDAVREAMQPLGYPDRLDFVIGVIEAICLVLYVVPRTAMLGAILITGILGGAIAAHLRVGDPLASHVLFGVYVGILVWGGLYLRDATLRALIPFRR